MYTQLRPWRPLNEQGSHYYGGLILCIILISILGKVNVNYVNYVPTFTTIPTVTIVSTVATATIVSSVTTIATVN